MGSILTNGVFLPAEGERNCYEGLAANWVALDGMIGGYSAHAANVTIHVTAEDKQAWNGHVADSVKHVTAEDKTKWDAVTSKADASALTAHTGDTTIHVTAEDKAKWDAVTSKADDSDVVHNSGNETCAGNKSFVDNIIAKKIISNVAQLQINARSDADSVAVIAGASAIDGGGVWVYGKNSSNNSMVTLQVYDTANSKYHAVRLNMDGSLTPTVSNNGLGSSSFKWVSINGLEPSSLSLPSDRSARVDISSYFTDTSNGAVNRYTVPANGYVYLNVTDVVSMHLLSQTSNNLTHYGDTKARGSVGQLNALLPVRKDDVFACQWYTTATNVTLTNAFFIPCQGNV